MQSGVLSGISLPENSISVGSDIWRLSQSNSIQENVGNICNEGIQPRASKRRLHAMVRINLLSVAFESLLQRSCMQLEKVVVVVIEVE